MYEPFGRYILLERIAVGGMAEIFRAKASGLGGFEKTLAIKRLHPRFSTDDDFVEMLIDEARITVELSHANIGQVFDLGKVDEHYFIAMEYIDGRDLYRMMRRLNKVGRTFPIDAAAFVAMEAAAGLDYSHRKLDSNGQPLNIVHRDVSPQNVLVSFEGDVKLVDFGIAKAALRAYETEAGIIKGKFYYMSPEQAKGQPLDHRTDVFSLGIVLYEMLTGTLLYKDEDNVTLLRRVREAEISSPRHARPEIPPRLERIVMRALARERRDRYPSAQHMQQDLAEFLRELNTGFSRVALGRLIRHVYEHEVSVAGEIPAAMQRQEIGVDQRSLIMKSIFDEEEPTQIDGASLPTGGMILRDEGVPMFASALIQLDVSDLESMDLESCDLESMDLRSMDAREVEVEIEATETPFFDEAPTAHFERADPRAQPVAQRAPKPSARPAVARAQAVPVTRPAPAPQRGFTRQEGGPVPGAQAALGLAEAAPIAVRGSSAPDRGLVARSVASPVVPVPTDPTPRVQVRRRVGVVTPMTPQAGNPVSTRSRLRESLLVGAVLLCVVLLAAIVTTFLRGSAPTTRSVEVLAPTVERGGIPQMATLVITSFPSGADVRVDGRWLSHETTPTKYSVPVGRPVKVQVALSNHRPYDTELTLEPGQAFTVHAALERVEGTLVVTTRPAGARVSVDGAAHGLSPATIAHLPVDRPVRVRVSKEGFEPADRLARWEGLTERRVEFALDPVTLDPVALSPVGSSGLAVSGQVGGGALGRPAPAVAPVVEAAPVVAKATPKKKKRVKRRRRKPRRAARRPRRPRADPPATISRGAGFLRVSSRQWGAVYVDQRKITGETPLIDHRLSSGRHEVYICFAGNCGRKSGSRRVTIRANETTVLKF